MKSYFIRIYFDGNAVTGFYVPNANDENHAVQLIKKLLICRIAYIKKYQENSSNYGEMSLIRTKSFLKSLKRPWRENKFKEKQKKPNFYPKKSLNVTVTEWSMPIHTGAWITDIVSNTHLCNI